MKIESNEPHSSRRWSLPIASVIIIFYRLLITRPFNVFHRLLNIHHGLPECGQGRLLRGL
ncbi:hypothetical protein V8E54_005924 [Elaphomyces granulatus]